jgi:Carboxypeptidase regulatory-like domain/TonB dependent receptor
MRARGASGLAIGLALATVMASPHVSAQVGSGALVGVVSDESGAAIAGATIVAAVNDAGRSREAGTGREASTGDDGGYAFVGLAPGVYQIRVRRPGFQLLLRDGVRIATGDTVRLDLSLAIGAVEEALTVVADAPLLRGSTSGLGQVVDQQKIVALPLNGRNFVSLATLAPGVSLPPGSFFPRINGGRPRTNEYLFDGISVLQPEPGQVAFFPNIDAIQEFKIESNSPPAEFGRFNGGVVNLTTKSGTNAFHGSAFEFFRHEALNARNFFAPTNPVKPEFRRNQFGAVLGGPLRRHRTFFFVDYQGQRQRIGRTVISTVPTRLQREGIFTEPIGGRVPVIPVIYDPSTPGSVRQPFPGNAIPQERFDPVARLLLARYPLPTSTGTANNYQRVDDERVDQNQFSVRLDQQIGAGGDLVFGRLTRFAERFVPVTPLPDGSGVTSGTLGPQDTTSMSLATAYRRTLSSSMVNELRVGDTRRAIGRTATSLGGSASSALGLPGIPPNARFPETLPTFLIAGYQQLGSPASTASDFSTSVTQVADSLTWLKGRHSLKLGADLRWQRLNVIQPPSPTGIFTFSSLFTDLPGVANTGTPFASFLLGQVQEFSIDLQQDQIRNRAHVQEYFVQDDWRVSRRLTVNAGVRYTLNFPSVEQNDQAAVFNLETRQLEFLGQDGRPRSARRLQKLNLGPRLGVVGRLGEKTIVRGAYSVIWIEQAGITTPFTTPVFPFLQTVSQRTLDNIVPAFVLSAGPSVAPIPLTPTAGLGQGVFSVDRDLGSGSVQQWNVSVQRELTPNLSFEAAYLGSKILHVGIPDTNLNQLTVEQLSLGSALLARVPSPYFGTIPRSSSLGDPTVPLAQMLRPYPEYATVSLYRNNVGTTSYQGLSARLERRLSKGLSYLVSYTRSKLVDDASSVFDASILTGPIANYPVADSHNRRLERDYSSGDMPHVFVSSAVWEIPVGPSRRLRVPSVLGAAVNDWSVAGVLTLQSGLPIAVTQATNANAFAGFGTQRPNLVGEAALPSGARTVSRWFNTEAFSTAPQFTLGSASRNPVRGPAYRNLDLALVRRVPLSTGRVLELRTEVFNVTNTPPFGAPNGTFGSAGFGSITTAGDPRVIQVALKYLF